MTLTKRLFLNCGISALTILCLQIGYFCCYRSDTLARTLMLLLALVSFWPNNLKYQLFDQWCPAADEHPGLGSACRLCFAGWIALAAVVTLNWCGARRFSQRSVTAQPCLLPVDRINGGKCLLVLFFLAASVLSLHAQTPAADDGPIIDNASPDGRYAFLTKAQPAEPNGETPKTCYLIEKATGKVLHRVADSDAGSSRLGVTALWSPDSKRFALAVTFNHFGAELVLYVRQGEAFHEVEVPDISVPDIPDRLKQGKSDWKWTGMNDQKAKEWRKDGSLLVECASTLQRINSDVHLTAERTVVLGFSAKSKRAKILQSEQKTVRHTGAE